MNASRPLSSPWATLATEASRRWTHACLTGIALLLTAAHPAQADNGTWTLNASGNATGTWSDALTANWSGGVVASGAGFTADFSTLDITTDSTITLSGARTIGNLIFGDATNATNGWILTGSTLTLDGPTPTITVNALGGKTVRVNLVLSGTAGLTKAGSGTLIIAASANYTGVTTVNAGILQIGAGTTSGQLSGNTDDIVLSGGSLRSERTGTLELVNNITGTGSVTQGNGAGLLVLSGNNTYQGATITSGGIKLNSTTALGNTSGVKIQSGGYLDLNGYSLDSTKPITDVSSTGNTGAIRNSSTTTATMAGSINQTAQAAFSVAGTGDIILSGAIKGTSATNGLTKYSTNTLTLSGAADNSVLAVTVSAGTVILAKDSTSSIHAAGQTVTVNGTGARVELGGTGGDQIADTRSVVVTNGTFDVNSRNETVAGLTIGNGTTDGVVTGTSGILTVAAGASAINAQSGSASAILAGAAGLTKTTAGTTTLTGANTYSGGTTVSAGTLLANNASGSATGSGALSVSIGGKLGGTGRIATTGSNGLTVAGDGTTSSVDLSLDGLAEDFVLDLAGTGAATFQSGAKFRFDLGASGTSDVFAFNGMSDVSIANFNNNVVDFSDIGGLGAGTYTLFTFDGATQADNYAGSLVVGTGLGSLSGSFLYNENSIQLVVVPEPGVWPALFGGLGMLMGFHRSRRRNVKSGGLA